MRWKKISLIGVGLLGGSLGRALRKQALADEVAGFVRRAASVAECRRFRAVDKPTRDLAEAVTGAELIVLCTPIGQMRKLMEQMLPFVMRGAIITDVGSAKVGVVLDLEPLARNAGAYFVGSHPMAGSEKTGLAAARADLYKNAVCVVTPTRHTNKTALQNVQQFWKCLGARVLMLAPDVHDELVCRSSHLPSALAAALASYVLDPRFPPAQSRLCANGFRDMTRIASGSPEMWRDIALANRRNLVHALGDMMAGLKDLRRMLKSGNPEEIWKFFACAKHRRDKWSARCTRPEHNFLI